MRAPRRRIRWGRVIFLLLILSAIVVAASWGAMHIYKAYQAYQAAVPVMEKTESKTAAISRNQAILGKRINILIMGIDDGDNEYPGAPKRSDTVLVASVNSEDSSVNILSIPRDTRTLIPGQKGYDKINHAYAYGGTELSIRTVESFLNLPIHYYVAVDWQAFTQVIELLGGVDIYVENAMDYEDPYANLAIHLQKGYQHLDGQKAGQYVRFRSDELGDIGRVQRQQRFLKALSEQVLQFETLTKVPSLINTIDQYVKTDMKTMQFLKLVNHLKGFRTGSLKTEMLPGRFATIDGVSYWVAEPEQVAQTVERLFSDEAAKVSVKKETIHGN